MPFVPVLEIDFGQERFFTGEPNELFKSGNFSRVFLMVGITADEFTQPAMRIIGNETSLSELNMNFADFTSKCFFYDANGIQTREQMAQALKKLYFPYDKIDARASNNLNHLCADGVIGYGVHRLAHFASYYTDVFYYKFSYIGRYSSFYYPRDKPFGVHHGDDIQYTISAPYLSPTIEEDDPENFMVERMTRIWEQFALKGNPNNPTDEYLSEMNWPKHDVESEYYLEIGEHLVEKQGLYLERYAVWDNFENKNSASAVTRAAFFAIFIAFVSHQMLQ
jgi:acetylcholinesterase